MHDAHRDDRQSPFFPSPLLPPEVFERCPCRTFLDLRDSRLRVARPFREHAYRAARSPTKYAERLPEEGLPPALATSVRSGCVVRVTLHWDASRADENRAGEWVLEQ